MIRMKKFITSAYGISSVDKLTDVAFSFEEFEDLDDTDLQFQDQDITEFLDKFLEAISSNKNLNSLYINDKKLFFDACVIFKNTNFKQLKKFSLITNDDIFLKHETTFDLPLFIESLESVNNLQLHFTKTDFPRLLLLKMSISLGKLKKIKKLSIGLKFSKKLTDEVMVELCKNIEQLGELKELHIDVDSCRIGNEGIIALANAIPKLTQLETLYVNLQRNTLIDQKGSTPYFNLLLTHPFCHQFQTDIIFQHEDKLTNPNYQALTNFQIKAKTLAQQTKHSFSMLNSPFISKNHNQIIHFYKTSYSPPKLLTISTVQFKTIINALKYFRK